MSSHHSITNLSARSLTQQPLTPPSQTRNTDPQYRQILTRHSGYNDSNNILFVFFAPDTPERGLYAQFVLDVCGIIAGNR